MYRLVSAFLLLIHAAGNARLADGIVGFDGTDRSRVPVLLSGTGLYASMAPGARQVTDGIIPFEVNSPLWSDGAHKERYVSVPAGAKIVPTDTDKYVFPDRTVMVKNFLIDTVYGDPKTSIHIETRFLIYRKPATSPGEWYGLSYRWRRDQTDAELVAAQGQDFIHNVVQDGKPRGKRWRYPSRYDCAECHKGRGSLGFITPQLNRPSAGNASVNQLKDLLDKGILSANPVAGKSNGNAFRWVGLGAKGVTLEQRARSYLASNCSQCHGNDQFMGPTHDFDYLTTARKFRYSDDSLGGYVGKPGTNYPYLLDPGFPDSSEILGKMTTRFGFAGGGFLQMPPLGTFQIDTAALQTIKKWACSLGKVDTLSAACRLPPGQNDASFWDVPSAIRLAHGAVSRSRRAHARIRGQRFEVGDVGMDAAHPAAGISRFDSKGRIVPPIPVRD